MYYRLVSDNCHYGERSMITLRVSREIEAINPTIKLKRVCKVEEDVRLLEFTDGSSYILRFKGSSCVLETDKLGCGVGTPCCEKATTAVTTPEKSEQRFSFTSFLSRMISAFRR